MLIRFGPFELDEKTRELFLHGRVIELQPRVFDVLAHLIRHRDRVVGKEELLSALWPGLIVTDASIQRAVSLIRSALRAGGCEAAIQTRARQGYRFVFKDTVVAPSADERAGDVSNAMPEASTNDLLERDDFLQELEGRFRRARGGQGQAVFIGGEAGIGKSALVAAFLAGAGAGAVVLRGYCDALGTPRTCGAILDLAAKLSDADNEAVEAEGPSDAFIRRLYARLRSLARGTVIVLEDLHWADEATLDFVRFLVRRIADTGCLLLATYRDDEASAGHPLRRVLGELSAPAVARLHLPALTARAVGQLARDTGRDVDAARVFAISEGNAFFVRELLSSPAGSVPQSVHDSVHVRLARCSDAARRVCEIVAVSPGRLEMDLAQQVLGDVASAIDEAAARGLVVHEGGWLTYRHELARLAVETALAPAHCRELHRRLFAALKSSSGDMDRLVHHARGAGDRTAICSLAPAAARRAAAMGAHREAASHFDVALAFSDGLPPAERARLLECHAYECYLTGGMAGAVKSTQAALLIQDELGDQAAKGRLLRLLSRQHWVLGDRAQAERFASRAVRVLEALPAGDELARAYSNVSQLAMLKGDLTGAVSYSERAMTLARACNDLGTECHALNNRGTARMIGGDSGGQVDLERSLELALEADLHEHASRAYGNLATCAVERHEVALARRYLPEALAYCVERDLDASTRYLQAYQARFELDRGSWVQAGEIARQVLDDQTVAATARIPALVVMAQLRARRGEPSAEALLDEAAALAGRTDEMQRIGAVAAARAESAWYRHDTAAVVRAANEGLEVTTFEREPWLAGQLLFWKSRVSRIEQPSRLIPAPYRHALLGEWRSAAEGFAAHEMPYEQALVLALGDARSVETAVNLLANLGARAAPNVLPALKVQLPRR